MGGYELKPIKRVSLCLSMRSRNMKRYWSRDGSNQTINNGRDYVLDETAKTYALQLY